MINIIIFYSISRTKSLEIIISCLGDCLEAALGCLPGLFGVAKRSWGSLAYPNTVFDLGKHTTVGNKHNDSYKVYYEFFIKSKLVLL